MLTTIHLHAMPGRAARCSCLPACDRPRLHSAIVACRSAWCTPCASATGVLTDSMRGTHPSVRLPQGTMLQRLTRIQTTCGSSCSLLEWCDHELTLPAGLLTASGRAAFPALCRALHAPRHPLLCRPWRARFACACSRLAGRRGARASKVGGARPAGGRAAAARRGRRQHRLGMRLGWRRRRAAATRQLYAALACPQLARGGQNVGRR